MMLGGAVTELGSLISMRVSPHFQLGERWQCLSARIQETVINVIT